MDAFSLVATLELEAESFFSGLSSAAEAMAEFAASCVETGMEFDSSMSKVQAVSGATSEQIQLLRNAARESGRETVFTAKESADALYYMAMAGWNTEQMIAGLPAVLDLAVVSGVGLATTSDIVTDALTAFGMEASEASYFADVLAATATNANTNVDLMGQTFKYVGPIAGAMGYSIDDVALAIGAMASSSVKGSQAGTALRNIITNLSKPTKNVAAAMRELGIEINDNNGKALPFAEVLDQLRGKFDGMTEAEKTMYAATLAGKYGMSGLLAIMNTSEADWNKLKAAIDGAWYSMDSFAAELQFCGVNIDDMKSRLSTLGITSEEFTDALNKSNGNAEEFANLLKESADKGISLKQVCDALGISLQDLQDAMDHTSGAAKTMSEILTDNLEGDITKWNSALSDFKIIISDKLTPTLRRYTQLATEGIRNVSEALEKNGWKGAAEEFSNWIGKASDYLKEDLPKWREAGTEFISALSDGLQKASPVIGEAIGLIGDMIGQFLSENAATITSTVTTIITSLTPGVIAAIRGIADGLKEAWPDVRLALGEMLEELGVFNEGFLSGLVPDWLQNLLNFLHIDLRGELDHEAGNLRDYFLQAPPHGTNTDRAQPAGTYNEEFVPRETLESVYGNTGDRSYDEARREAEQQAEPTNTNEQIVDWLHDNAEQGGVTGTLFGIAETLWTGATGAQNRNYRETEALIENLHGQQAEQAAASHSHSGQTFTVQGTFVDGISENANRARESLMELEPLVETWYYTGSTHKDDTSGPATKAYQALLKLADHNGDGVVTESDHIDGTSDPAYEAYQAFMKLFTVNGDGTVTFSNHDGEDAVATMLEIMDLLDELKARDGQHTESSSTQTNTIIENIIHRERWETPGESREARGEENVLNATAMHGGRILRGATVFGQDQFGRPLVGGETGPEAVVGVNSLYQMIGEAVGRAMAGVIGQLNGTGRQPNYQIVLDSGVLVGELVSPMDGALDRRAAWRGGGRA